jgi:hypothetical protein
MAGLGRKVFNAGEVLSAANVQGYLQDQVVQVYSGTAARSSALGTAVSEGMTSYLTDSNELSVYTSNGTAAWSPVNLSQSPNAIINGAFDIWQRGTSFNMNTSPYYHADRWQAYRAGAVAGGTSSRQTAGLDGFTYCTRIQRNSGNTDTFQNNLTTSWETAFIASLWGKTLTLSFWARAGANYSGASNALRASIWTGTGTDSSLGNGFTSPTELSASDVTLTTSWQRFSVTSPVLTNAATQLAVRFVHTPTGTAGTNDYFEVTGVQLEAGSVATPFRRNAPSLQGELAACQRYYYRASNTNGSATLVTNGGVVTTTIADTSVVFPVTMRTAPSSIDTTNVGFWAFSNNTLYSGGTITMPNSSANAAQVRYTHGSSVFTAGSSGVLYSAGSSAGSLGFSAEL